ncbi:GntR family transcriptional regulator [Roseateles toxinivorans]|uniref:GntR family transcriptional regulator n=1 Tax=Roseateles toxinivorans TaxID=270368 RepID=A0A4V6PV77_9BURK|nr:FCD domain-containing protein [Roseateles toxinivorans]TDP74348.1 GntR family transcriptional regulator [Roseateles toxinivorans]
MNTSPAAKKRATPARAERSQQGLAHGICEQLQQLIYSGEIAPGERLNEAALALRMGTSRGPIREAIRMLTGIGLVLAVPNRGVFVRQISVREMLEIYELRALLLGFAAQQAAEHLSEADRREFEQLLDGMDAACEADDGQHYYQLNLRFHALLMAQCRNQRAQQAYEDHVKELHLYRRRYFDASINMRRSNKEHRQIFEAIAKGTADRANKLAQAHVLQGRQRLLSTLDVASTPPEWKQA